ncbi:TetR/AcrR family transcriptional regulator [Pseudonocardia eucalypti]|uniref:TetR/AcrR family transcriptional regulator n=1 Tax=Pseudonocardia eucalypti TaxID=648755 RepID=A0ABP9QRX1_9PSEU|nr:AcrR family transcriptional regulator [Pseudonocardia eucalypti]
MPRTSAAKDRILDASAELFRRQGYAATGLKQIVAHGGGPIGSLYHYFPDGKENLATEALTRSGRRYGRLIESVFERTDSAAAGVRAWFDMAADLLERSDYADGCPIATVALEVANTNEVLRGVCAEVFTSWQSAVVERLVGEGCEASRARELASFALAALEGAFILSRTSRDAAPVRSTGTIVAEELRA